MDLKQIMQENVFAVFGDTIAQNYWNYLDQNKLPYIQECLLAGLRLYVKR